MMKIDLNYKPKDTLQLYFCSSNIENLGPGNRFGIWVQGCNKRCKSCFVPESQDLAGGYEVELDQLINEIFKKKSIDGITISGGEPMLQWKELHEVLKKIKGHNPNLNILLYTGYNFMEDIYDLLFTRNLLGTKKYTEIGEFFRLLDYWIDGEYIEHLDDQKGLRGSNNQNLYANFSGIQGEIIISRQRSLGNWEDVSSKYLPWEMSPEEDSMYYFMNNRRQAKWESTPEGFYYIGIPTKQSMSEFNNFVKQRLREPENWTKQGMKEPGNWTKQDSQESSNLTKQGMKESENLTKQDSQESSNLTKQGMKESENLTKQDSQESSNWTKQGMKEPENWTKQGMKEPGNWTKQDSQESSNLTKQGMKESENLTKRDVKEQENWTKQGMKEPKNWTKRDVKEQENWTKQGMKESENLTNQDSKESSNLTNQGGFWGSNDEIIFILKDLKRDYGIIKQINENLENKRLEAERAKEELEENLKTSNEIIIRNNDRIKELVDYQQKNVAMLKKLLQFCIFLKNQAEKEIENNKKYSSINNAGFNPRGKTIDFWEGILLEIDNFIKDYGFKKISPKIGSLYDSISQEAYDSTNNSGNIIVEVINEGYKFNEQVVIKARVRLNE